MSTEFRKVMKASKVRDDRLAIGRMGVIQVAVVRRDGELLAFKNNCPHAGSPLSGGTLSAGCVVCPRHGWRFSLTSGECPEHPTYALRIFEAREKDGWIEVRDPKPEILVSVGRGGRCADFAFERGFRQR